MDYDLTKVRGLLTELRECDVPVQLDGEDLKVQGDLHADLLKRLRAEKGAVVAYLKSPPTWPCATCDKFSFPASGLACYWCREKENAPDSARCVFVGASAPANHSQP